MPKVNHFDYDTTFASILPASHASLRLLCGMKSLLLSTSVATFRRHAVVQGAEGKPGQNQRPPVQEYYRRHLPGAAHGDIK